MGRSMNYKLRHTPNIVAAFIMVPVLVLVITIVSIAIRQNVFEKRYVYSTTLDNALGVSTQTALLYKGFEIGKVKSFELDKDGSILVKFYVLKRYHTLIRENCVIYRTTIPITNKTTLDYVRGPGEHPVLSEGSHIPSTDFAEGRALLRLYSPKSSDPIAMIIENVGTLTSELNKDHNADKGALMRILVETADLMQKADGTLDLLNHSLGELAYLSSNLNKDHNAGEGVVLRAANNLADITEALAGQTAEMERLIATINEMAENFADPTGLAGKLIDPEGDVLISPLSRSLGLLGDNLVASEAILAGLARANPELLLIINNLNEALEKAALTLEAMNNNPLLRKGIPPSRIRSFAPAARIDQVGEDE